MKRLKKGRARRAKAKRIEATKQDLLLAKMRHARRCATDLERAMATDYTVKPWAAKDAR